MSRYKIDLREIEFLLFEQLGVEGMLAKPPFEGWSRERISSVLAEVQDFVVEHLDPIHASADREGCRFEYDRVRCPSGFKQAWAALSTKGYKWLGAAATAGGAGAPRILQAVIDEMIAGANASFSMYPALSCAVAEVLRHFGTDRQKQLYLARLTSGRWSGTMCLTEPHAGSDIGSSLASAMRLPDGRYMISGTKIFISGGDQDMTENIVHLVLARTRDAPPGTRGLSLFIVPKYRTNSEGALLQVNDVVVGGIEEMMGLRGSATCVLNFGERDDCIGELVGTLEHQGVSQMFQVMSEARISVGAQSVGVAARAYLTALDVARENGQLGDGVEPLSEAWILVLLSRQLLLEMKARVEGARALLARVVWHQDMVGASSGDVAACADHQGWVEFLAPLVKSYCSDQARVVSNLAIDLCGWFGVISQHPTEQAYRDAVAFLLYEGTNHIHAMDLVGRKLGLRGGRNLVALLNEMEAFAKTNKSHAVLADPVAELGRAQEALGSTAMRLLMWHQTGRIALVPLAANRFLRLAGEVAVGWLLLDGARIACDALERLPSDATKERAFYEGKKQAALYYAKNILPNASHTAVILLAEDASAIDIDDGSYSTI